MSGPGRLSAEKVISDYYRHHYSRQFRFHRNCKGKLIHIDFDCDLLLTGLMDGHECGYECTVFVHHGGLYIKQNP